jgi:sortase (surface protein transpeptidase)
MRPTVQRLVLTACHPPHSARQRLVVFAKLVDAKSA